MYHLAWLHTLRGSTRTPAPYIPKFSQIYLTIWTRLTEKYDADLVLHDLSEAISRLSGPNGPVEEAVSQATGTDHSVPVGCHQNRHHLVRETVQSGASGCESDRNHGSASNNKPRREAGFICPETPARDRESWARVGKRVRRFERPTFTLAT